MNTVTTQPACIHTTRRRRRGGGGRGGGTWGFQHPQQRVINFSTAPPGKVSADTQRIHERYIPHTHIHTRA